MTFDPGGADVRPGLVSLIRSIIALEVGSSLDIARRLAQRDMKPKDILTACEAAMTEICGLYDSGEYFMASLVMAGEIMNRVIKTVSPARAGRPRHPSKGRVLIGTVKGEIHCLGKNIAGALLGANGFEVLDLGADVPPRAFVEAASNFRPDAVGLSVLLTTCFHNMEATVGALRDARGEASSPSIFIAGAQVTPAIKDLFRADHCVATVFDTVRLCESLCAQNKRKGLDFENPDPDGSPLFPGLLPGNARGRAPLELPL
ncbi:MAG: cobalamin-dependent protein [Deltaproteobacteria bacterium]|jgi:methanogenic corrinoid protein MtbC1|nr:cobalamin-dependent protein [Deltaproteobacteria bacterium]